MQLTALSVHGITSMTPSTVMLGTVTVNLQLRGLLTPSVASCDRLAAPSQYHSLLHSVRSASSPRRSAIFAKKAPARSHLTM